MEWWVWVILAVVALGAVFVAVFWFVTGRSSPGPSEGLDDLTKARVKWGAGQSTPSRHSDLDKPRDH